MKICFFIPLFVIAGCSANEKKAVNTKDNQYYVKSSPEEAPADAEPFDLFLQKFNSSCDFQESRIEFPLPVISVDYDTNLADTSALTPKEFECVRLTSPRSNIIEGKTTLKFDKKPTQTIVTLGVEDSGVHIEWIFILKDNVWYLSKIFDAST